MSFQRDFSWKDTDISSEKALESHQNDPQNLDVEKYSRNLGLFLMEFVRWGRGFFPLVLLFLGACACVEPSETTHTLAPFRATSRPYKIKGVWYYPQQHYEFEETGVASWYGERDGCHTLPTASGRPFNMFAHTCAHKTLPLPCVICVTNLKNGRQVILEVIDRGPFKYDRILDVSVAAAKDLGFYQEGTASVHIKTLVAESLCLPQNQKAFAQKGKKISSPQISRKFVEVQKNPCLDSLCSVLEEPSSEGLSRLLEGL